MSWGHPTEGKEHGAADEHTNGHTNGRANGGDHGGNNGDEFANGSGGACRKCGKAGHLARECPQGGSNACFNCGEEGHNKADCTNPRIERPFDGTCNVCLMEGHRAAQCLQRPPEKCRNCLEKGHRVLECTSPRKLDLSEVADKDADVAWKELVATDKTRDLDDIREALVVYCKAVPATTYAQLEFSFRQQNLNTHFVALEKELEDTFTLMNLQGFLGCKYQVGLYFGSKCPKKKLLAQWPATPVENMERLKNAGIPVDKLIPKCGNCNQLGHGTKSCTEEKVEREGKVSVNCVNCSAIGHRARDCPEPRKDLFACHNCKQSGHKAEGCTEPRSAKGVECKNCNEVGHFVKDCPTRAPRVCNNCLEEGHFSKECEKPRNPATIQCRNCDEMGHVSKECPKLRDYSRVTCSNCDQKGHTKVRCKAPFKEKDTTAGYGGEAGGYGEPANEHAFESGVSVPVEATGGDW